MTIDEYRNSMMKLAEEDLPKETKRFLATETQKLKRRMTAFASTTVPVSGIPESDTHKKYHQSFKAGKTYKYNESLAKRVYNKSGHGRYVESGRPVISGYKRSEKWGKTAYNPKYGQGKARYYKPRFDPNRNRKYAVEYKSKHYLVVFKTKTEFDPVYYADIDAWIEKMLAEGKL